MAMQAKAAKRLCSRSRLAASGKVPERCDAREDDIKEHHPAHGQSLHDGVYSRNLNSSIWGIEEAFAMSSLGTFHYPIQ